MPGTGTPPASAATRTDKKYWDVWATEIQAKGWTSMLYDPRMIPSGRITILDIASSGDITEWQIDLPSKLKPNEDWIRTNRERLRTLGLDGQTRVIVFEQSSHLWIQELIGLYYNIEPTFFRDIAHSRAVRDEPAEWNPYDHQLPEFMIGRSSQHLNFGYGWTGKIIVNNQNALPGPRNIGGLLY